MAVAVAELVSTLGINGFILAVNILDWVRGGQVTSYDLMLSGLSGSQLCRQWFLMLDAFIASGYLTMSPLQVWATTVLWQLTSQASLWFATCLSLLYFLKIGTFTHPGFLWLKCRVPRLGLQLLLGTLLVSAISTLTLLLGASKAAPWGAFYGEVRNCSDLPDSRRILDFYLPLLLSLESLPPLSIFLVSISLLVSSLLRHVRHMGHLATGHGDPSPKAHITATKTLVAFLFFYLLFVIANFLVVTLDCPSSSGAFSTGLVLMGACASGNGIFLVLGNSKLRKAAEALVTWATRTLQRSFGVAVAAAPSAA
ncbi:taste receptor type 2 member 7-like [Tachyglossus aculeatus]|uniref:taste receptor type 2 member 7-like n=1 Tax=Tachyglossus aculeatus TaxID=9261 RepID=UPI0018F40E5E|nr:taste receptor type 2 member 7-like [Tachyglossus aculeatus]